MKFTFDTDVIKQKVVDALTSAKEKLSTMYEQKQKYPLSEKEIEYLKKFIREPFKHSSDEDSLQKYGCPYWVNQSTDTGWELAIVVYTTYGNEENYFKQVVPQEFINNFDKIGYCILMKLAARQGVNPMAIVRVSHQV